MSGVDESGQGSMFGGLEVRAEGEESAQPSEMASGFSFLATAVPEPDESESASGFSFLSTSATETCEELSAVSGFSFMGPSSVDPLDEPAEEPVSNGSGFSFLNADPSVDVTPAPVHVEPVAPVPNFLSADTEVHSGEIKLGKVAAAKNVKKKKRAPKVGYARDEEAEEAPPPQPANTAAPTVATTSSAPAAAATTTTTVTTTAPNSAASPTPTPSYMQSREDGVQKPQLVGTDSGGPATGGGEREGEDDNDGETHSVVSELSEDNDGLSHSSTDKSQKRKSVGGFLGMFRRKDKEKEAPPAAPPTPHGKTPPASMASFSRAGQTRTASSPVALQKQSEPMQLQAQELQRSSAPYPIAPVSSPTATTTAKLPATTATGMSVGMSTAPTVHVSAPHVAVSPAEPAPPSQSPPPTTQKATDTPSSPPAPVISPKNANPSTHPAPVEVCSTIKDLANEVISSYETQARDLAAEYAYLFEEERSMNAELEKEEINGRMLQQKVEETEMEQAKLAEAEDFESADALSAELDRLREEVQIAAQRVHSLRESIAENEEATATNRRNQSLLLDTTVKGLSNLRRQQIEEVEKFYEDNRKRLKKEDGRISMEEERVSMERSGVAREESALEEERQEIETAIHAQTEEVQQDKTDMEMRLMGVTAEIRNLEKLLAEKRQQEKDLKRDLSVVESKIDAVRKKYDRRLQRIHERVVDLTSDSEACRKEEDSIRQQRSDFEVDRNHVESTRDHIADWIDFIQLEIDVTSSLRTTLDEVRNNKLSDLNGSSASVDLNTLKENVSLAEISLNNSMASLVAVQEGIRALTAEDADIQERIPALENEKKAHATNKRFKEAAAVLNSIKALQARREEIVQLLETATQDTISTNANVEAARADVAEKQAALKLAERDADMLQLDQLLAQSKTLRRAYQRAEKRHTKKMEEHKMEARLSTLALELLRGEVESVLKMAGEIKEKHDLAANLEEELSDDEVEAVTEQEGTGIESTEEGDSEANETDNNEADAGEDEDTNASPTVTGDCDGGGTGDDDAGLVQGCSSHSECDNGETAAGSEAENGQVGPIEVLPGDDGEDGAGDNEAEVEITTAPDNGEEIEAIRAEKKKEEMLRAHEVIKRLDDGESALEEACDNERYDEAAEISETVDSLKEELVQMLADLQCSREDIVAFCSGF